MIGKTISHYRILEKLGEGAMGIVYRAEDTRLERTVALKFLTPQILGNEEEKTRFVNEAKAAGALNHPHICTVHEIDEVEGHSFIAMECIEGRDLRERIRSGPLKIGDAVRLAIQLAEGLNEAHENGIVHRDIKPANIMLTPRGRVKIMDFGLAKAPGRTQLTRTRTTLGTVAYMSPEQARGEEVDHRTDIWSLGIVLYEMVTGRLPFKGDYEQAVVYAILNTEPESVSALRADLPPELERIVSKAMAKRLEERYRHVGEMLAALRAVESAPRVTASTGRGREQETQRKMLAVLPFDNLGPQTDEYFAAGITEEITSRLAAVSGLGVISRTSAAQYDTTGRSIRQIGADLGVGYILEGSVRWARAHGNRVRITAQLIRVSDDTHIWSERYDRVLEDIFAVQSEIAEQIVRQLEITLLEPERRILGAARTRNLDAYEAYLRGLDHAGRPDESARDIQRAVEMFERAVERDPTFGMAYAELSRAHSRAYHQGYDRTPERRAKAKAAVDRALELLPEIPEAHLALGYYHYVGHREYERAIDEFTLAQKGLPNDARIPEAVGFIRRRQGMFDTAVDNLKEAFSLNPRDASLAFEIGLTYTMLRDYEQANHYYDRSISLAPDQLIAYFYQARNCFLWEGGTERARATLEGMPRTDNPWATIAWFSLELYERAYEAALERLQSTPVEMFEGQVRSVPKAQLAGLVLGLMNEPERARASLDSARVLLEAATMERPEDHRFRSSLGIVYAGLGMKVEAIREGRLGTQLYPVSNDAVMGTSRVEDMAIIYATLGEHDAALDEIEYLLSVPSWISVPLLRLDPRWDTLRDHPRFKRLLERHSGESH